MTDYIHFEKDEHHIAREKEKAKQLRKTHWWHNQVASGRCHYCQQQVGPSELTMDHVVPLARGGKSTKGNIVPCCKQCNSEKKYLTPVDILMKKMNDENTTKDVD